MTPVRPPVHQAAGSAVQHGPNGNVYNVPRALEVYTLPENMNAAIPQDIRDQFHQDDHGRVLFYTAPPLNRPGNRLAPEYAGLGHSVAYLNGIQDVREKRRRLKVERDAKNESAKREEAKNDEEARQAAEEALWGEAGKVIGQWVNTMNHGTQAILDDLRGWQDMKEEDQQTMEAEKKRKRAHENDTALAETV